ncbi:unnamed protein product [Pleuronectes platessa]|uniref:Uncharacterized protein n=1 Tax=Pleuronectes platessa TaxID=8262 RepID=A0A9N7TRV5_PLEPL|nr:unnamed protein product [Pleuronectes platessa]
MSSPPPLSPPSPPCPPSSLAPLPLCYLPPLFFGRFSRGYAKEPDNLGACSRRASSAERVDQKLLWCRTWQRERERASERVKAGGSVTWVVVLCRWMSPSGRDSTWL